VDAPLPNVIVIGAMKCGTTALHRYLDDHPDVSMAESKEVNFFFGPEQRPEGEESQWWWRGRWHRGVEWYSSLFDPCARVRGESSPGYTSPDHEEVPGRMARVVPAARILYLVRDPVRRAFSQYHHHRRDGTENRPPETAVLDERSQYVARSRYHERLAPYLELFDPAQVHVVVTERMWQDRRAELARVYEHVGVDPDWWSDRLAEAFHVGAPEPVPDRWLRAAVRERVADDTGRLRGLLGDDLAEWAA
jgi:hypothetical protein